MAVAVALSLASHGAGMAAIHFMSAGEQLRAGQEADPVQAPLRARLEEFIAPAGPILPAASSPRRTSRVAPAAPIVKRTATSGKPLYYPAHVLDERPQVRVHVEPAFPLHSAFEDARVRLRLFISEDGRVDEVALVEGEAPEQFKAAASSAFRNALFTPGRIAGKPVKSMLSIEVLFGAPVPLPSPHARVDAPR